MNLKDLIDTTETVKPQVFTVNDAHKLTFASGENIAAKVADDERRVTIPGF